MKVKKGFRGVWSDFPLSPSRCMDLVVKGKLKIVGKDEFRRTLYEVVEEFDTDDRSRKH